MICAVCHGTGRVPATSFICAPCDGRGEIPEAPRRPLAPVEAQAAWEGVPPSVLHDLADEAGFDPSECC